MNETPTSPYSRIRTYLLTSLGERGPSLPPCGPAQNHVFAPQSRAAGPQRARGGARGQGGPVRPRVPESQPQAEARPRVPESPPRPRCPAPPAAPSPAPAFTAPLKTAPAPKQGRHPAVSPFWGRLTRKPAPSAPQAPLQTLGPRLGAAPGVASSRARPGFPKNDPGWRAQESDSPRRSRARAVARGPQRVPFASPAHGGSISTAAAPVGPAVREMWA